MDARKRKKLTRWRLAVPAVPLLLFLTAAVMLYLPPVQNWAVDKVAHYASQGTGMEIRVGHIRLGFPLNLSLQKVAVMDSTGTDTLVFVGALSTQVALRPLLGGEVKIVGFDLTDVQAQTSYLIPSACIEGEVKRLSIRTGDIDLASERIQVKSLLLDEADISLTLLPAGEEPEDTVDTPVRWSILLDKATLSQVKCGLQMPADSMSLSFGWGQTEVVGVAVNIGRPAYGVKQFSLTDGMLTYDQGTMPAAMGLDPSHISLQGMEIRLGDLLYSDTLTTATIGQLAFSERSGLTLQHTEGAIRMDDKGISLPTLFLQTAHSHMRASGLAEWTALTAGGEGNLSLKAEGEIGKADLLALTKEWLPKGMDENMPPTPLALRAELNGNLTGMTLDECTIGMDSVMNMQLRGEMQHLTNETKRKGEVRLLLDGQKLGFLTLLADPSGNGDLAIPQEMKLKAALGVEGTQYKADLTLDEGQGNLTAQARYNTLNKDYALQTRIDSVNLHHFLPKDSLGCLSAHADIRGRGTDLYAASTALWAEAGIDLLQYGTQDIAGVSLHASIEQHHAKATFASANSLLDMQAQLEALLRTDTTYACFTSGDFSLQLKGNSEIPTLVEKLSAYAGICWKQLGNRKVLFAEVKSLLPTLDVQLRAGTENPLNPLLNKVAGISMKQTDLTLHTSPDTGIRSEGYIHGFRTDSLEFDTIRLTLRQDSASIQYQADISNATGKQKPAFTASLSGNIGDTGGEALLRFADADGRTGLELGTRAQLEADGLRLSLFPEEPTVGFRTFSLNPENYLVLNDSGKVTANISLLDQAGTGLRLYSTPHEEALQDMTLDIARLKLGEVLSVFPYLPDIEGALDAELHVVQLPEALTFSGTAQVENMIYEQTPIGTLGLEAVYLPTFQKREHQVNLQLLLDGTEIMTTDGSYTENNTTEGILNGEMQLVRFPLRLANAFLPGELISMQGDLLGNLTLRGSPDKLRIDGSLQFDAGQLASPLYSLLFTLDNRPVSITNSRLMFNDFNIYARGKNPFILNGSIDFSDLARMTADLRMRATEYELLNAKQNKQSVAYGKVFVNLYSSIRGPLDALTVRGTMNVLGKTDVTYVLKDSPLSVNDRLGSMVTFTNFADTVQTAGTTQEVTLDGLDMVMNVQIDEGAQVRVDLSSDNYIELQGGGNLSMQYSPQEDFTLTGRYTLLGGEMKYSLPVIPLKTFRIGGGSYVEFTGNPMNPMLNVKATERVRASVSEEGTSRYVNFDVGVDISNTLDQMGLAFTLEAPEDVSLQNQLAAMSAEERGKLAVTMLVTGMYTGSQEGTSGGFSTNNALNSFLQSEISNIAGSALKTVDISIGLEDNYATDGSSGGTDYSFRFAKRFWNNRLSVIIGGRISTGNDVTAAEEGNSFIDDVTLEWRLDDSGTRYVQLFHNKNYESILEGEITETGVGLVLRRKVNKLGELFIFRKQKQNPMKEQKQ